MGYIMNSCYRGDTKISCVSLTIIQIRKLTFRALALRRRANAQNVSFRISLRWHIHIINPADKANLSCNTPQRRSSTVSVESYPFQYHNTVGNKYYRFKGRTQLFFYFSGNQQLSIYSKEMKNIITDLLSLNCQ